ncbi:D(1) dopamine receptor-like [Actinia tenebrosa]|uniref:D(1) dopamine receptor-like n=1 Tax=Actinia tenebrosa TaxID=6105 RepID=A0A6P8IS80_ACTTE|nr:D(1) dopamine receptor-like [Actinia tenebrosa]XP_031570033.1 D(1) dopamine receptor-like [Actinia tenebrosa]
MDKEHTKTQLYELSHRSLAETIVETGFLVLIAVTSLIGNALVLFVFYKSPRLRSRVTSYYIITLAISDVLLSTIVMPIGIAGAASGRDIFGSKTGEGIQWVYTELVFGSVLTTALIAVNRFFCVTKPSIYRKYFKPRPAKITIVSAWLFSLTFIAVMYLSGMCTFEFYPGCFMHFPSFRDQITANVIGVSYQMLFAVVPLIITVVCYWKLYKHVKSHNVQVTSNLNAANEVQVPTLSKEEIAVTRSLMALVCGFIVCWIPCSTVFHLATYINLPRRVEAIIVYTSFASSAINPIVYNVFNKPFRRQFLRVCCHPMQNQVIAGGSELSNVSSAKTYQRGA